MTGRLLAVLMIGAFGAGLITPGVFAIGRTLGLMAFGYSVGWSKPAPEPGTVMITDCRMDDTCPGDFSVTIIGGWPADPLDRCWLAADLAGLDGEFICQGVKENLG